jgi:hypothetical protein
MPMGRPSTQVRISAATETITVSHRRSPITSVTGRRHSIDIPKLPCTTRRIHFRYCTYIGCPRPYWIRRFCASSSVTTLPIDAIWAM